MDASVVIVVLAIIQVIALLGIALLGLAMARRGRTAAQRVQATFAPAARIRSRGAEGIRLVRGKSERIVLRAKALGEDLTRKWRTALHLVEEVVHPGKPPLETVTEPIDRGRRLAARISRLGAAARKAAGGRQ
jgi:hypothetical protein